MKTEHKHIAVYPCKLSIVPGCIFNTRDPIVIGVRVEEGLLMNHTPICVPNKNVDLGIITSIESSHKTVEAVRQGTEVCIKIETLPGEAPK
ncbi:hypothetical protein, partial [Salmonella sp. s51228]|uniref:hypothetical protein n=1 Tax=Salmonella sp. s51228 TaxID=3159652 RepID=UPI0039811F8F